MSKKWQGFDFAPALVALPVIGFPMVKIEEGEVQIAPIELADDAKIIHGFDSCVVGVTSDRHLVYDYAEIVLQLMRENDWSELDAIEYADFNVAGLGDGKGFVLLYPCKFNRERCGY
mgnify:CR=1 FL=1